MSVDALNQLPHTGDSSRSVLLAERPDAAPEPLATGEFRFDDDIGEPSTDSDQFLLDAANNGRRVRIVAAVVAVVALVVIAISLFPSGSGSGTNVLTRAAALNEVNNLSSSTTPPTSARPSPSTTGSGDGPVSGIVDSMEDVTEQLGPLTSITVPEGWVEPLVEPESEWIDGGNGVLLPDLLLRIRFCESTNNYNSSHVVSSARGAYQFLTMSWEWYGHAARYGVAAANLATPAQQDEAALLTFQQDGARPWAESRKCWDDRNIDSRYLTARPAPSATTVPPAPTTTTPGSTTATSDGATSTTAAGSTTSTSAGSTTTPSTTPTTDDSTTTTADGSSTTAAP